MRMARELGRPVKFDGGAGLFVCVDGFGPTSPEERAAGLPGHGEAHTETFDDSLRTSGLQHGRDADSKTPNRAGTIYTHI